MKKFPLLISGVILFPAIIFTLIYAIPNPALASSISEKPRPPEKPVLSSKDIDMFCAYRCSYPKKKWKQVFKSLQKTLAKIESAAGTPLPERLKPIEVHLSYDRTCGRPPYENANLTPTSTSKIMGFANVNAKGKAMVCLNRPELQDILAGKSSLGHELSHHYFPFLKYLGPDDLTESVTKALLTWSVYPNQSTCAAINKKHEPGIYNLCKEYGFTTLEHMKALVARSVQIKNDTTSVYTRERLIAEIKDAVKATDEGNLSKYLQTNTLISPPNSQ